MKVSRKHVIRPTAAERFGAALSGGRSRGLEMAVNQPPAVNIKIASKCMRMDVHPKCCTIGLKPCPNERNDFLEQPFV